MTMEHLRPLLESPRDTHLLYGACQLLAAGGQGRFEVGQAVEACTAPFQYALSTKAGCECIPHTLQALCELNPEATVISVDGISAIDLSRRAMLEVFNSVLGGAEALPFVRMFYGQPSRCLWEDEEGIVTPLIKEKEASKETC